MYLRSLYILPAATPAISTMIYALERTTSKENMLSKEYHILNQHTNMFICWEGRCQPFYRCNVDIYLKVNFDPSRHRCTVVDIVIVIHSGCFRMAHPLVTFAHFEDIVEPFFTKKGEN